MEKFIKFLCLNMVLLLPLMAAEAPVLFKGDYFLYSDDDHYIYGSGNISLSAGDLAVAGDVLYMDVNHMNGVIYGNVAVKQNSDISPNTSPDSSANLPSRTYDALFFNGIPPKTLRISYGQHIRLEGDDDLKKLFLHFVKKRPEALKDSSLYFEFREFVINKNKKIKAKTVIPYMMGLPTVPLKRFTVKRGQWKEKTMLAFKNVNYSGMDGLSLSFLLRLRETAVQGDHDVKFYERGLFKMGEPKRGVLFSGRTRLKGPGGKKELLDLSTLINSGDQSFNLRLSHRGGGKYLTYGFTQVMSGRRDRPLFSEFAADVTVNRLKYLEPRLRLTHDLKQSYSYRFSTPLRLVRRLRLNVAWQRRIIRGDYRSDTTDFTTSMDFNGSFFNLGSDYKYSRNLLTASARKNFSVNMRLKPVYFLMRNMTLDLSSFYMFSELPAAGQGTISRVSPGVHLALRSAGALLPLGLKLVPGFTFNHLWDNREEDFTDFNYALMLQKEVGVFRASLEYLMASRYRADNFWIEGSGRQHINLNLELNDRDRYAFLLRFNFDNQRALENTSFTGRLALPYGLNLSAFVLYYNLENRFGTTEVLIEKTFKRKIKIQGGYSLALKRFFVKCVTL